MKPELIRSLSHSVSLAFLGLLAITLCVVASASDGPHDSGQDSRFEAIAKVPEKARKRLNPVETDPQSVLAGRKLYAEHCAECHGTLGEGGKKAPSLRANQVHNATPGTLFWILSNGVVRRGMPVWSKLPEPQRWQIVSFLKSLPPPTDLESSKTYQRQDPAR